MLQQSSTCISIHIFLLVTISQPGIPVGVDHHGKFMQTRLWVALQSGQMRSRKFMWFQNHPKPVNSHSFEKTQTILEKVIEDCLSTTWMQPHTVRSPILHGRSWFFSGETGDTNLRPQEPSQSTSADASEVLSCTHIGAGPFSNDNEWQWPHEENLRVWEMKFLHCLVIIRIPIVVLIYWNTDVILSHTDSNKKFGNRSCFELQYWESVLNPYYALIIQ